MKTGQTATEITAILRAVFEGHQGETIVLSIHDHGNRKVSRIEGQITSVTSTGILVQHQHRAGRSLISFRDLFARHIEVQSPDELADDVREALASLGVRVEVGGHQTPVDGRFGARPPVGPGVEGFHHLKKIVG